MSRKIVKETIDGELKTLLGGMIEPIPFYDTENVWLKMPTDDLWVSTIYYSNFVQPVCYDHDRSFELGSITVAIFSEAGKTFEPAYELADKIQDYFRLWMGVNNVEIIGSLSTLPASAGDANGNYFVIELELSYQHFF